MDSVALRFFAGWIIFLGAVGASGASVQNQRDYPTDYCAINCPTEDSLSTELISNSDLAKTEEHQFDYGKFVPKDLQSGQDPNAALSKIADTSLQYWWNNSGVKNTPAGQNISSVEKSLKQEVNLGRAGNVPQKVNMSFDVFQTQAKVSYEGYTNAEVFYKATDASMGLQMINKLGGNKDLIFGETVRSSTDQSSQVTFKWNF